MEVLFGFTIWAVLGTVLFLLAGFVSTEIDNGFAAMVTFAIGVAVFYWGFQISLLALVLSNWWLSLLGLLAYAAIGGASSLLLKWPRWLKKNANQMNREYDDWAVELSDADDKSIAAFQASPYFNYNAWDHAEKLSTWAVLWPFTLTWELLRAPTVLLGRFGHYIYIALADVFQSVGLRVTKRIFENAQK